MIETRSHLSLVSGAQTPLAVVGDDGATDLLEERPRIVLAGADAIRRDRTRTQLRSRNPGALVIEVLNVWELLTHAPECQLVVLAGDLDDAPADALMRLLSHRHPKLPVVRLRDPAGSSVSRAALRGHSHERRVRTQLRALAGGS
jgi:hypothetical protein